MINMDDEIERVRAILKRTRTIATVGLSANVTKDSYGVVAYLQARSYRIVPVNPHADRILGKTVYRDLLAIPREMRIDVVQLFRPPDEAPTLVEQAIAIGAGCVWMQEGIINEDAAATARAAGLDVVMDRCMMALHRQLFDLPPLG